MFLFCLFVGGVVFFCFFFFLLGGGGRYPVSAFGC